MFLRLYYGASRLQKCRFATVLHVFAPSAPWDRVSIMALRACKIVASRLQIELAKKKRGVESLRDCRNYIMALRACKTVASRLCFFGAHRIHVFAPAAPWDGVRGKKGIEICVEMAEIFN